MSKRLSVRSSVSKSATPVKIESTNQPKAVCRMVAITEYEPENPDEIAIMPDDILNVTEMNADGDEDWAKGYNTSTKLLGVFPIAYCKLIASTIPKPVKDGKIYECMHSFNPEQEIDDEEERQDYIAMERGDFVEFLPNAIQEEFDADDLWAAVRHCMSQSEGLVPMNRIEEVKTQSSDSKVAPRLSVNPGKSSANSKVRKSIRGVSVNVSNLGGDGLGDETVKLSSPLYFKAKQDQEPEFDEDLSVKVGDILVATEKTTDNEAYYGYLKSQPRNQGFFLVDIVDEIPENEAESSEQVKSVSAKRASMRKSVRLPASDEKPAESAKLTPESNNDDMQEIIPYYVVVTQSYTACDAEELTLVKDEVVKVTHSSKSEEGEWVYGLNVKTEKFGLFPLDFTAKSNEHGERENSGTGAASAGVDGEELMKLNKRVTDMEASIEQGDENLRGMRSEVNARIEEISSKCQDMNVQILGFSTKGADNVEIEAMKAEVSKMEQQIGEFETKFGQLDVEDLKLKLKTTEENVAAMEAKFEEMQPIKDKMEESESSMQQLKDGQKSIEEQIQIEKESNAATFATVNDEMGVVKTELAELKLSIDSNNNNNKDNSQAFDSDALKQAVQANEESLKQNDVCLESLKATIATFNNDLQLQQEKEAASSQKLIEMESKIEEFNSGMDEIANQTAGVSQKFEEKVAEIDYTTSDLRNKLADLNSTVEATSSRQDLTEKLESLEIQVNSLSDKSEVFATSDSLNALDEKIKAHDDELIALKDKTDNLELKSKNAGETGNANNVSNDAIDELKIQIANSSNENKESAESLKEQLERQSGSIEQMGNRLNDIESLNVSSRIEELNGKVKTNSETCEAHKDGLSQVKGELDELKAKVETVSKNASEAALANENKQQQQPSFDSTELEEKIRQISVEAQNTQKQTESLESKIVSNDEKMAAKFEELEKRLTAKIEQYDAQIAALKSSQTDESLSKKAGDEDVKDSDDLAKKYAKLKDVISKHAKKIVELESKINNLGSAGGQSVPSGITDDLKHVKDDLETVKKDFAEKNQRMSRKVTSMLGQIKQLQGQ